MRRQKILLAHLNSNGDCLYASVLARQIKEIDHPGCHLTWAINPKSKQTILHNPYVDATWDYPTLLSIASPAEWKVFVKKAAEKKAAGEYDVIYYTQVIGNNLVRLNGDIRPSTYRNYPHPLKVPFTPVIRLTEEETNRVRDFANEYQLQKYRQVILVECGPESFSISFNHASAMAFALEFAAKDPSIAFILSSAKKIDSPSPQVIDGSTLSFRENAELTKYCHFFIGCSSGISWLATSDWAKPLPKIIVIDDNAFYNTSMADDHRYSGLPTDNIIELKEGADLMTNMSACFEMINNQSFALAKAQFNTRFERKNFLYLHWVCKSSFDQWDFFSPFKSFAEARRRFGFHWSAVWHMLNAYIRLPYYIPRNILRLLKKRN